MFLQQTSAGIVCRYFSVSSRTSSVIQKNTGQVSRLLRQKKEEQMSTSDLKKKYKNWVIVFSNGARFIGECAGEIKAGFEAVLTPCFQAYHQVQLVQTQPGGPPGVAFIPIIFPLDMCAHSSTPLNTRLNHYIRLSDMHEDDLLVYDEMLTNCVRQSEDKIQKMRAARAGITLARDLPKH